MPARPCENAWFYPRPPALQHTSSRLRVIWRQGLQAQEVVIADTTNGYRVLETSHPPTYYIPPEDVRTDLLRPSSTRRTLCEWKGVALYHDFYPPPSSSLSSDIAPIRARIWSYPSPNAPFAAIKDYLCFYPSVTPTQPGRTVAETDEGWTCYVDEDRVSPQEGGFYGGWVTPEIEGKMKGGPGTWAW